MTTTPKTLPDGISIYTLAKWLDNSDPKTPQVRFKLRAAGPRGTMDFDFSGGILAFAPETHPETRINGLRIGLHSAKGFAQGDKVAFRKWFDRNPGANTNRDELHAVGVRYLFECAKVDALDVVHCLISDMDAGSLSFKDFCGDFGYDEDSRKAFATWETCRRQGDEFRNVMRGQLDALRELTADL